MIAIVFLLYLLVGIQVVFKPNRFVPLQFLFCLFVSMLSFNLHSNLLGYL